MTQDSVALDFAPLNQSSTHHQHIIVRSIGICAIAKWQILQKVGFIRRDTVHKMVDILSCCAELLASYVYWSGLRGGQGRESMRTLFSRNTGISTRLRVAS